MPNLVDSLSPGYFHDFFRESLFIHNGDAYKVRGVEGTGVAVVRLRDDYDTQLPKSAFQGFKKFEYPLLGYRRFDENVTGYCHKSQSVHRGLTCRAVVVELSPVSRRLVNMGLASAPRDGNNKGLVIMQPEYDSPAQLRDLLEGRMSSLVLSNEVLIEPSVSHSNDHYSVYYKQVRVGKMDAEGAVRWNSQHYQSLVEPLLQAA